MNGIATNRQHGFSLIEVVAAFAVFAIVFAAIMQLMTLALSNTRAAHEFTQAALLAQSKLDVIGLEEYLEPGVSNGQFDDKYSWQLEVEPYIVLDERGLDPEENPVALYRATLVVSWGDALVEREAAFETLRAVDVAFEDRRLAGGISQVRPGSARQRR